MLTLAAVSVAAAVLLAIRRRGEHRRHVGLDRGLGWALGGLALVLATGSMLEPARRLAGLEPPAQCLDKPHAPRGVGPQVDVSDEVLKDALRQRRLETGQRPARLWATRTREVARLTGPGSVNETARRWDVHGTDLGFVFRVGDRYGVGFGDTFGGVDRSGWRSNVLAWAERDPTGGLWFTGMHGEVSGRAEEVLGSLKLRGWEETVIPTNGVALDDRVVLHYMSVTCWGVAGSWAVDHAGLAVSRDGGRTFRRMRSVRWSGDGPFAQVAFVDHDGYLYAFGLTAGRDGPAWLGRVPRDGPLDRTAWRYWDGEAWSPELSDAVPVVHAPVGELSVRWQDHHGTWLMLYLHEERAGVVLRTAPRLTGPWSAPRLVASAVDHPTLYAPYVLPATETSTTTHFTMSRFDRYNVSLMEAELRQRRRLLPAP